MGFELFSDKGKSIPVIGKYDVLIGGGGPAGVAAAVAAARNGAKTFLIEQLGFLGGSASGSLVTPLMLNRAGSDDLNRGILDEVKGRLASSLNEANDERGIADPNWFDPEMLKFVLEELALESGVEILYHTFVADVVLENCDLVGLILENKSGRQVVYGKVTVDATGDADIAVKSGVPFESGRPPHGTNQAMSLRFLMGNVNLARLSEFWTSIGGEPQSSGSLHIFMVWGRGSALEPIFRKAVEDGILDESDGDYFQAFSVPGRPGELAFNCPRISDKVNGADVFHLTQAQINGRKAIKRLIDFCRKYLPGCEKAYLVAVAPMVGVRESRRIIGEYVLTASDVLQARKFPDAIVRNAYPIDIHRARTSEAASRDEATGCEYGNVPEGDYHEIPYRCLVPKGVDGLLVAGRCISATFEAQSSIRIQPNCYSLGQAAGTAAALSVNQNIKPRELDGIKLRNILKEQGANL
ncbi:MAG: FAD-dependent oxidoreductase [Firmicutes bacterium]|nr:FAD-dependent oxidoreductase [Bacillota bacterium]